MHKITKHVTPGAGPVLAQGVKFEHGRGPLGDATYQISRLLAFWFRTRRFFKFSSQNSIFSLCDLDMQWTRTILTILVEGHPRIICVKLFQNWTRGLEVVI